ncbi:MAG: endospore germination permease [Tissierella sp.]|nr:endospore germination permease [Tissierella sp.]
MKECITSKQMVALITLTRLSTGLSIMPTIDIRPYNQDIWIMILVSIIYTTALMTPLLFLANKFRSSTMIGYFQIIYGKSIGKVLGFFYGLYFLINSFNTATIQSELIGSSILTDTSESLIVIAMMLTCIYCVSRGTISGLRSVEVLAPVSLTIVIILMMLGVNNFKYYLLLPIMADSTILDINLGAMELSTYFSEVFFLTMFIPYLENKDDINKILVKSAIYSLGLLTIIVIICQIIFGVEYLKHSNFPFLIYARSIDIFDIVERIDSVAVVAWLITSIYRVSSFLLISVAAFREIFNKNKDEKIILLVLGLILSSTTLYAVNTRSVIISRGDILFLKNILFVFFVVIIPLISCIVYFIRRKSIEGKGSYN